jgi:hypothetical protein
VDDCLHVAQRLAVARSSAPAAVVTLGQWPKDEARSGEALGLRFRSGNDFPNTLHQDAGNGFNSVNVVTSGDGGAVAK